ncbi:MAG: ADP-ribosylglycohydrolase family protein [Fimbriimonadales bacterium]|nr:ADP-ribosylglycohydrolase family protein [Fimbriimonadales bacterium]
MNHLWLYIAPEDFETEWLQCQQEGLDVSSIDLPNDPSALSQSEARDYLELLRHAPPIKEFPYVEPNSLEEIKSERPADRFTRSTHVEDLEDRIEGAWYGRCAGCLLGKPVEGWHRSRISGYLKETGRWPLEYYFSCEADEEIRKRFEVYRRGPFIENIDRMPEDDDLNYTTVGLAVLEKHGRKFTSDDVAQIWMDRIPILRTCTAERVAYRNLCNGLAPPESGARNNPYREWIGAQIRADMWGYVNAGDPETAAEFAWRDARVSHVKNGMYGEMWIAAMIAAAFVEPNVANVIKAGLGEIPSKSRLAEAINKQLANRQSMNSYEDAIADIHSRWNEKRAHDWCHTISNAEVVAMALLWGEKDFQNSICMAVEAGFDTDCNGATVGSIIGAMQGRFFLPERWLKPFGDTLETGVQGFHKVSIKKMAERTLRQAKT